MTNTVVPNQLVPQLDRSADGVVHDDLRATQSAIEGGAAPVVVALSTFDVLRIDGVDAVPFLQGQVTADVASLADGQGCMGAYCTAKGRMLASFVVLRDADALRLVVRADLLAAFQRRLSMFVLRSKVKITAETQRTALIGVIGADIETLMAPLGVTLSSTESFRATRSPGGDLWIPFPGRRLLGLVETVRRDGLWNALQPRTRSVGAHAWDWIDIQQGLPFIEPATQDHLTPHMANLDLIGGVSFQKGCYPGQEIVARTQHLGKVKRRMYRAHLTGEREAKAGDAVFGADHGDQAIGVVVSVAPTPEGGQLVLASMHSSSADAGVARLHSLDGPLLAIEPLPYPIGS